MGLVSSGKFLCRLFICDSDGVLELDTWDVGFVPLAPGRRGVAEWAREHLANYDQKTLRELLCLPPAGDFQVVFDGTMNSYHTNNVNGEDWDEDFGADNVQYEVIPPEHLEQFFDPEETE